MRIASRIFAALTLSFAAIAALEFYFAVPDVPPPPWTVDKTEFELGNVPSGKRVIGVTLSNTAEVSRRVLGMQDQCKGNCCFKSLQGAPVSVNPGGLIVWYCEILVGEPGPIDAEIKIYLEENGIRTVTLHVTGTAVEAPHAPK